MRNLGRTLFAAAAVLTLGCGTSGKDQESVIHRRLEGEPKTLNPLLITSDPDLTVLALLSRNLLDYDKDLELVSGLADVQEDETHRIFTVRVRKDARWEDGTPITSADVVTTIRTLVDPKTPSLNRKAYFEGMEKVEAVDPLTARVTFQDANPTRRHAFAFAIRTGSPGGRRGRHSSSSATRSTSGRRRRPSASSFTSSRIRRPPCKGSSPARSAKAG